MTKKNPRLHVSKNPQLRLGKVEYPSIAKDYPSFGKESASLGRKTIHGHKQEFPSLLPKAGERGSHGCGIHNGSKGARKNPHFPRLLK